MTTWTAFWLDGLDPNRARRWRRYLLATLLSIPPAYGLRVALYALLVPDLATRAQAALRAENKLPLTAPLRELVADPSFVPAASQPHPLLRRQAPRFTLANDRETPVALDSLLERGPVVLVFYYGYFCSHCVSQLFGVNEDLALFRELGAEVVAVSADSPELTRERFERFGRFGFPVLSDPDRAVHELYGVLERNVVDPDNPNNPEPQDRLSHGTFILDSAGQVLWAYRGPRPFVDNQTLLNVLARASGR